MKKQFTIAVALVAFSSTAAFAGSMTKVVNDEMQGRLYLGAGVDYTALAYKDSNNVLSDKQRDRFNFGLHAGYKQPLSEKWFVAAEFGPHWSNLSLTDGFEENWGADALVKGGYNVTDAISVAAITGYRYSKFDHAKTDVAGHALVLGVGAEYAVTDNVGLGLNYKHDFWMNKPTENLNTDNIGLELNYYF